MLCVYLFICVSHILIKPLLIDYKMSAHGEKRPSEVPRARGDVFKWLVLSDQQSKSKDGQFTTTEDHKKIKKSQKIFTFEAGSVITELIVSALLSHPVC